MLLGMAPLICRVQGRAAAMSLSEHLGEVRGRACRTKGRQVSVGIQRSPQKSKSIGNLEGASCDRPAAALRLPWREGSRHAPLWGPVPPGPLQLEPPACPGGASWRGPGGLQPKRSTASRSAASDRAREPTWLEPPAHCGGGSWRGPGGLQPQAHRALRLGPPDLAPAESAGLREEGRRRARGDSPLELLSPYRFSASRRSAVGGAQPLTSFVCVSPSSHSNEPHRAAEREAGGVCLLAKKNGSIASGAARPRP
eukprot:3237653-Alexandrium_andersonii.AAC.1